MKLETIKAIFFWFAFISIGILVTFQVSKRGQLTFQEIPVEPKKAPEFNLDGISLSQFKGQNVLLHFWATWCEPCRAEMPLLIELAEKLKGKVTILAVAVDSPHNEIQRFFGNTKPPFVLVEDSKHQIADLYGISQFPETLLIGPDGFIQAIYIGPQDWSLFRLKP